jgi:hypothetical protein
MAVFVTHIAVFVIKTAVNVIEAAENGTLAAVFVTETAAIGVLLCARMLPVRADGRRVFKELI